MQTQILLAATDDRASFAHNTHRVILQSESSDYFVGWPDPTDKRNSDKWNPETDKPLRYPKFAWKSV